MAKTRNERKGRTTNRTANRSVSGQTKTARKWESRVPVSYFALPKGTHPADKANRERVAKTISAATGFKDVKVALMRNERGQTLTESYHVSVAVPLKVGKFISLADLDDDQAELISDIIDGLSNDEDVSVEIEDLADTSEGSDDSEGGDSEDNADPADSEDDDEFDPEEQFGKGSSRSDYRKARRKRAISHEDVIEDAREQGFDDAERGMNRRDRTDILRIYEVEDYDAQPVLDAYREGFDESLRLSGEIPPKKNSSNSLARALGVSGRDASRIAMCVRGKRVAEARRILANGEGLPFRVVTASGKPYSAGEVKEIVRLAGEKGKREGAGRGWYHPEMFNSDHPDFRHDLEGEDSQIDLMELGYDHGFAGEPMIDEDEIFNSNNYHAYSGGYYDGEDDREDGVEPIAPRYPEYMNGGWKRQSSKRKASRAPLGERTPERRSSRKTRRMNGTSSAARR